ncbi:MAG: hypothetical protein Kow006_22470 [Gammaproteobacteria bacterium]
MSRGNTATSFPDRGVTGVRVELAPETLLTLLRQGSLRLTDLRCLDCASKRCLVRLFLKACAATLDCVSDSNV